MAHIENEIKQLIKNKYDPWCENQICLATNARIKLELADWLFGHLRAAQPIVEADVVEGIADDIFYEFFSSDKWLKDYDFVKIYNVMEQIFNDPDFN